MPFDITRKIAGNIRTTAKPGVSFLHFTGAVSDGETYTTGSRVYEFDTDSSVSGGNVQVDISGDQTADAAATALAAAINADSSREVDAWEDTDGDGVSALVAVIAKADSGVNVATSETITNASIPDTGTIGEETQRALKAFRGTYAVDTTDTAVTGAASGASVLLVGGVELTSQPGILLAQVYDNNDQQRTGIQFFTEQINSNKFGVFAANGSGTLANGDTIHWLAIE